MVLLSIMTNMMRYLEEGEYYPTIGMGSPGAKLTTNLGETDFTFTFDGK